MASIRSLAFLSLGLALASSAVRGDDARPPAAEPFRDCPACPEMVRVPAGTLLIERAGAARAAGGGPLAEPARVTVRIARPFAIGRYEVTRAEYRAFVEDEQYEPAPANCRTWNGTLQRFADDRTRTWQNPGVPAAPRDEHPVTCVSWDEARAYVRWLARRTGRPYRLPSEVEWEYAARAGTRAARPWGEGADGGCESANTYDFTAHDVYVLGWEYAACADNHADVAPVGWYRANAFGLHDAIGNVAEWVEDCATDSLIGRPLDGRAWVWNGGCERRVQRGGSWVSLPGEAQSAARADGPARERADSLGFRVALDLDAGEGR